MQIHTWLSVSPFWAHAANDGIQNRNKLALPPMTILLLFRAHVGWLLGEQKLEPLSKQVKTTNGTSGCNKSEKIHSSFLICLRQIRSHTRRWPTNFHFYIWTLIWRESSSYLELFTAFKRTIEKRSHVPIGSVFAYAFFPPRKSKANEARKVRIKNEMFGTNVRSIGCFEICYSLAMRMAELNLIFFGDNSILLN